jgi:alpha-1,6-mannosyltransferase
LPDGVEAQGPLRWIADLLGLQRLDDAGLMLVGLIAVGAAAFGFILILRESWNRRISMRMVFVLAIAFHVLVLTLPLLFSRDVYSYAYYGRIASTYGANPYVFTPHDFPYNSLSKLTWPGWRDTPSVYGPLFTWVSVLMTGVVRSVDSTIRGFQVLAAFASIGTMAIVARLVQRVRPERAVFAVAVIGLNPIVVFHVVGGGHNDMLVAFFVAAAVSFLFARRELASAICLGLGMSVKASAVVPLILLLVAIAATVEPERRGRVLAKYAAVVGGIWLVLAAPYLQRANPTLGLFELSGHDSGKAPGQLLVHGLTWVGTTIGGPAFETPATIMAHVLLFGASIVAVWMIARRIWLDPAARGPMAQAAAWGWALLTVILLAPMLGAWYLVWVLPLAWALPRVARRGLVILCVAFTLTELVTENSRLPDLIRSVRLPFGHPIALIVCAWIAFDLIRRLMRKTPMDAETAERQFGDAFEAGPATHVPTKPREPLEPRLHTEPTSIAPSEAPKPGGSLIPLRFARRR